MCFSLPDVSVKPGPETLLYISAEQLRECARPRQPPRPAACHGSSGSQIALEQTSSTHDSSRSPGRGAMLKVIVEPDKAFQWLVCSALSQMQPTGFATYHVNRGVGVEQRRSQTLGLAVQMSKSPASLSAAGPCRLGLFPKEATGSTSRMKECMIRDPCCRRSVSRCYV